MLTKYAYQRAINSEPHQVLLRINGVVALVILLAIHVQRWAISSLRLAYAPIVDRGILCSGEWIDLKLHQPLFSSCQITEFMCKTNEFKLDIKASSPLVLLTLVGALPAVVFNLKITHCCNFLLCKILVKMCFPRRMRPFTDLISVLSSVLCHSNLSRLGL